MFTLARAMQTRTERMTAVAEAIDRAIEDGSFRLTDLLNQEEPFRMLGLEYLHGSAADLPHRQGGSVEIRLRVDRDIVKDVSTERQRRNLRRPAIRQSQVRLAKGEHTMTTRNAFWYLYNFGRGVDRVDDQPIRIRRDWCEEVGMHAGPITTTPTERGKGRAAPRATA